ncbi:hypothetical protein O6H91_04G065900 [Diphasiastrum complanatum]|nr:hypothetical protein O6H91_04G065900 [Diphasiastrum complanatum]
MEIRQNWIPSSIYIYALQACGRLEMLSEGKLLHTQIMKSGLEQDAFVGSHLVNMYGRCGSITDAQNAFEKISDPDVFSWTAMIVAYSKSGLAEKALKLFNEMKIKDVIPNEFTFVGVLNACASLSALKRGKQLHRQIIKAGLESNLYIANSLIDFYAKCGLIEDGWLVFSKMLKRDVVSWNTILVGYAKYGHGKQVLELFHQMLNEGIEPNEFTFVALFSACASLSALEQGKWLHSQLIERRINMNVFVGSALIDMYAKCCSIEDAREVFDELANRNIVAWNAMIVGYSKHGQGEKALDFFYQLQNEGLQPTEVTFVGMLNACASLGALNCGRWVHSMISERRFHLNVHLGNTLVNMYAKCDSIEDASQVFEKMPRRDLVSWNAMIAGYARQGHSGKALLLFQQMQREGPKPDAVTFVGLLKAFCSPLFLEQGKLVHWQIMKIGYESNLQVGNCLIDMYFKCGSINDASKVFNQMHVRDVISWNAMIMGYARHGHAEKALQLFRQMEKEGLKSDDVTFLGVIHACGNLSSLDEAKIVHSKIFIHGLHSEVFLCSALIDMYAKCGSLVNARKVFDTMPEKNVVSWNAMIAGYAMHGMVKDSLKLFEEMEQKGVNPEEITFVSVLSACSRAGLVEKGYKYFGSMCQDYGITPTMEHYGCMVDLFCRAGELGEALGFIQDMPVQPSVVLWMTYLSACKAHGNVEQAEHALQEIVKLTSNLTGSPSESFFFQET